MVGLGWGRGRGRAVSIGMRSLDNLVLMLETKKMRKVFSPG